jgi:hypothetical protein
MVIKPWGMSILTLANRTDEKNQSSYKCRERLLRSSPEVFPSKEAELPMFLFKECAVVTHHGRLENKKLARLPIPKAVS